MSQDAPLHWLTAAYIGVAATLGGLLLALRALAWVRQLPSF